MRGGEEEGTHPCGAYERKKERERTNKHLIEYHVAINVIPSLPKNPKLHKEKDWGGWGGAGGGNS